MDFSELYQTYHSRLVEYGMHYLQKEDAEDVVQDVLMTLWIRRDALTFVNDVNAYVFSSVKNRCLDAVKRQAFRQEYFRRTLASTLLDLRMEMIGNHSQVANEVELHEMERRVEQAVNSLPKACRTIFLMSREQGMKYKEISQALNISPNTVECQMVIALKKLRQQLKVS